MAPIDVRRSVRRRTIALLADAMRLYERLGFLRCPEFDLRAKDVFGAPPGWDTNGPAYRYDV